jgi:hypothetical protein
MIIIPYQPVFDRANPHTIVFRILQKTFRVIRIGKTTGFTDREKIESIPFFIVTAKPASECGGPDLSISICGNSPYMIGNYIFRSLIMYE